MQQLRDRKTVQDWADRKAPCGQVPTRHFYKAWHVPLNRFLPASSFSSSRWSFLQISNMTKRENQVDEERSDGPASRGLRQSHMSFIFKTALQEQMTGLRQRNSGSNQSHTLSSWPWGQMTSKWKKCHLVSTLHPPRYQSSWSDLPAVTFLLWPSVSLRHLRMLLQSSLDHTGITHTSKTSNDTPSPTITLDFIPWHSRSLII